ncbi:MAG: family 20 glycosylhydrolase [Bacteroidales bacterium]|nr:family 20 glycosylhydrolase [Bacteroidales bacterium]
MKKFALFFAALPALFSCSSPCSVSWVEGAEIEDSKEAVHTMVIHNPPAGTDWTIWFSQFCTPVEVEEGAAAEILYVSGTLYMIKPVADSDGQDIVLNYKSGALVNHGRAPEAFCLQKKGEGPVKLDLTYSFLPADDVRSFEYTHVAAGVEDMIPQLKKVTKTEGTTTVTALPEAVRTEGRVPGWYRIVLDGKASIEAADEDGAYYAAVTMENLMRNNGGNVLPNMVIEDYPDLAHRGLMLDVSRNFTDKEGVKKIMDILSHYKANVLHLHLGDDEGWRIEIEGLPELTRYGAFRGIPQLNEDGSISEPECLQLAYSASLGKNDSKASGNGFYSREDFIEILRYAKERHISVIPEFDTPGHSRAAILSMKKRLELTGDASCLLSEASDSSNYVSAQDYTDNVINVVQASTYAFIEKVFDSIIEMYAEADAPLPAIHVGGDEVPDGAWLGSPSCRKFMEEHGWSGPDDLANYFFGRVMDIAEARGVKLAGWQEIASNLSAENLERLSKLLYGANMWSLSHGLDEWPYELANSGINVILSMAPNTYLDFAYNDSKSERGLNWGGYVDERRSFSLLPFDIYKSVRWDDRRRIVDISHASEGKTALSDEGKSHIIGVQGQLWAETLRNFDHVTYYLLPKMTGILERGWNALPQWADSSTSDDPVFVSSFDKFYSIIVDHEMPYYDSLGVSYHKN